MALRPEEQKRLIVPPATRDRHVGPERGLAGDVAAGGAFRVGAAEIDVLDFFRVELGALDSVLDGMAAEGRAVGHVETATHRFGEARPGR